MKQSIKARGMCGARGPHQPVSSSLLAWMILWTTELFKCLSQDLAIGNRKEGWAIEELETKPVLPRGKGGGRKMPAQVLTVCPASVKISGWKTYILYFKIIDFIRSHLGCRLIPRQVRCKETTRVAGMYSRCTWLSHRSKVLCLVGSEFWQV